MTRSRKSKKPLTLNKRSIRKLDEQQMKQAAGGMSLTCDDCPVATEGCPQATDACATEYSAACPDTGTKFTIKYTGACTNG
jgi:hypothetical protein